MYNHAHRCHKGVAARAGSEPLILFGWYLVIIMVGIRVDLLLLIFLIQVICSLQEHGQQGG